MPNEPKNGVLPPSAYVNFLRVANNQSEFFLSFGQVVQEQGTGATGAHLVASLVTSPAHAKAMLRALAEAVERHEQRFGAIAVVESPAPTPAPVRTTEDPAPRSTPPPPWEKPAKAKGA